MPSPHPKPPTNPPAHPADDTAYYRAILHELIDRGAALARHVHEQATAATPTPHNHADADPTLAFDRIARAIRRCIGLAQRLATPEPAPTRLPNPDRAQARRRIIRQVENNIFFYRKSAEAAALRTELAERLADPELDRDLQTRPLAEIIEELCQDLGVSLPGEYWPRRSPAQIAELRARAAAPSIGTLLHRLATASPHPLPS